MAYGRLNPKQELAARQFVDGQTVHDLGAGDLSLSHVLLRLGAGQVVAVDSHFPKSARKAARVGLEHRAFADFAGQPEVALVSWPVNWSGIGLVEIVARTPVVLYVGTNTGGTACGGDDLWDHLVTREVLAYVPDRENTLIVYGPGQATRPLYGEELAARNNDRMWMFDEAEKASQQEVRALGCAA